MAVPQVKLEYWNGSNWIEAKTHSGNTAVIICKLKKKLNNPSVCELFLANTSKDYSAAGEDKEDAKGLLTDTFTDFMDCRVSDLETGLFLFRGRVYDVRNQYDFQYGSTIKVILKDVLQEFYKNLNQFMDIYKSTPKLASEELMMQNQSTLKNKALTLKKHKSLVRQLISLDI